MIQCSIENETKQVIIDTGATITVFKRTRNLPESKLRLKSATSHKAALYGPEWTDIKVGKQVYRFPVYEADISENLLGYDFLDTFEGVVNTKTRQLELEGDVKVPYKVVHSVHKGDFASGKVSYAIRANQKILLKPFVERQISTKLETDLEIDQVGLADALRDLTISGYTRLPEEDVRLATLSTPSEQSMQTKMSEAPTSQNRGQPWRGESPQRELNGDQPCSSGSSPQRGESPQRKRETQKGSARDPITIARTNKQSEQVSVSSADNQSPERFDSKMHLGLLTTSINNTNTKSQLPPNVLTSTGIIPCVTGPVDVKLLNMSDHCVKIPKYAIVAEVLILHPIEYELEEEIFEQIFEEDLEEGEELANESEEEVIECPCQTLTTEHEIKKFQDAEYILPNKKPIPDNEPLPEHLAALVRRCTNLTPQQKKVLEKLLRRHLDVFAPDNFTFGRCPWMKFRIDTGDHPPIKQNARPVPLHYRKEVYETFMKYLKMGAIRPSQSAWPSRK